MHGLSPRDDTDHDGSRDNAKTQPEGEKDLFASHLGVTRASPAVEGSTSTTGPARTG
jgi:hypothetical protein